MPKPVIHLIPHTHWDREWYLPLGGLRARLVEMLDRLIEFLAQEPTVPGFLLDGQTALLEDYLAVRPERREQVSDLVRAGRISTGPWYILADEQIPCGESLIRNLQLGQFDCARLGRSMRVVYSPDAFGHPAVLPTLGREFGVDRAVVWRGLGDQATGGKDLFRWRGPDGGEIVTYHLPPDGYEIGSNLLVSPEKLGEAWKRVASAVLSRAGSVHVAVLVGADHHGVDPRLPALARRLAAIDDSVDFRFSSLDEYFAAAATSVGDLKSIEGELRWSYGYTWTLQGTHATRAQVKRRNSALELLLIRQAEPLTALVGLSHPRSEPAIIRQAWRELVQCHFHDAICGCCHDAVTRAVSVRMDDVESAGREVVRTTLDTLVGHDPDLARDGAPTKPRLIVWNGAARARGGVMVAEATYFVRDILVGPPGSRVPGKGKGYQPFALTEAGSGMTVAVQVLSIEPSMERRDGARHYPDQDQVELVRFAFPLPRGVNGFAVREFEPVASNEDPLEDFTAASREGIWNGRVSATVDRLGRVSLEDPASGERYPALFQIESELDLGDTYSFCPAPDSKRWKPNRPVRPRIEAAGPLVSGLSWRTRFMCGEAATRRRGQVNVESQIEIAGDSPAVRYRIRLDNQALNHRLRLRLPTGIRKAAALAGAQFGSINREPVKVSKALKAEWPVATAPAHRWVAVGKKTRGLALFAPGFFEYQWTADGDLLITLLRAVGELSKSDLPSRPGHAGWPTATPLAQCLGEETIELGVAPIREDDLGHPDRMEQIWEDLFVPPTTRWIRGSTVLPVEPGAGFELEGEGLVFSSCVGGEQAGELILRCFNHQEHSVEGVWRFTVPVVRARRIRADGVTLEQLPIDTGSSLVRFIAGRREILTFHLTLQCV